MSRDLNPSRQSYYTVAVSPLDDALRVSDEIAQRVYLYSLAQDQKYTPAWTPGVSGSSLPAEDPLLRLSPVMNGSNVVANVNSLGVPEFLNVNTIDSRYYTISTAYSPRMMWRAL